MYNSANNLIIITCIATNSIFTKTIYLFSFYFFQILILKLNREGPFKKDVFRAPGNQASVKELINFLQTGTILNIEHYSVYTVASVLKKFLSKIPGSIFGEEIEKELLRIAREKPDPDERGQLIHE